MAITTLDGLVNALANSRQKFYLAKSAIVSQITGGTSSYWRLGSFPITGTLPGAVASCNNLTPGAIPYNNPVSGSSTYIARLNYSSTLVQGLEIHDRIAHMGGLVANITTAQTVGLDIAALEGTDNIAQRRGRSDYASLQWWVEIYTATGSTTTGAVVTYTNHLGVTGKQTSLTIAATATQGRLYQIFPLSGDNIRSIESIALTATTGTAGNFGITCTLQRTEVANVLTNLPVIADWAYLGLVPVFDSSCLMLVSNNTTTSSGTVGGAITLVQG